EQRQIGTAGDRRPDPGLLLRPRQIDRQARHSRYLRQCFGAPWQLQVAPCAAKVPIKISWRGLSTTMRDDVAATVGPADMSREQRLISLKIRQRTSATSRVILPPPRLHPARAGFREGSILRDP